MKTIKATIKTPEMTLVVFHKSRMNYSIILEGTGEIAGRGSLGEAVAFANHTAKLGLEELKTRLAYAPHGLI
jgi:hypothetical protein